MRYDFYIGIDPGTTTGLAIWNQREQSFVIIDSGTLLYVYERLLNHYDVYPDYNTLIRIEDARKRKWYGSNSAAKQQGAGSIKRDCTLWEEVCEHRGWDYEMIHPLKNATKLNAETFENITGWTKQTNEHKRDAAMIVYGL